MKKIMKKLMFVVVAILISLTIFSNRAFAVSISFEISGDGILETDGKYYRAEYLPVGGKLNIKAEEVTRNDMHLEGIPMGETSRRDVTDKCTWSSSNENVLRVTNGTVEGISEGVECITVTYDGRTIELIIAVGEENHEEGFGEGFSITQKNEIKNIKKGNELQLDVEGWETLSNIKNDEVT